MVGSRCLMTKALSTRPLVLLTFNHLHRHRPETTCYLERRLWLEYPPLTPAFTAQWQESDILQWTRIHLSHDFCRSWTWPIQGLYIFTFHVLLKYGDKVAVYISKLQIFQCAYIDRISDNLLCIVHVYHLSLCRQHAPIYPVVYRKGVPVEALAVRANLYTDGTILE